MASSRTEIAGGLLPSILKSELNHFAIKALRRTSHIIDACMHIQTLKRLAEAAC